ncbi:GNAT family N-acetyltransferase [Paenibacillus thermotolerans]|uniref:GNAT family N-acetyltransferase n=1 Tax=Paenibacillus thermotolerans TaxID=3027807 RepID=UPI0023680518|nr:MULTISPECIES: GNAT family N-acetyltransferase [unclassified Paenibacillus]
MEFVELDLEGLQVLEEWFKDPEVLKRLTGKQPLRQWFQNVQQSSNYWAWMVTQEGQPVGQIAIEIYSDRTAALSLLTHPQLRSQGYGKRMLEQLLLRPELAEAVSIKANIEPDNIASVKCFTKAGFTEQGTDEYGYLVFTYSLKVECG